MYEYWSGSHCIAVNKNVEKTDNAIHIPTCVFTYLVESTCTSTTTNQKCVSEATVLKSILANNSKVHNVA